MSKIKEFMLKLCIFILAAALCVAFGYAIIGFLPIILLIVAVIMVIVNFFKKLFGKIKNI